MTGVIYTTLPESITYMPLPDGQADVWIRKNIEASTDDDGNNIYIADEVYFRTSLSITDITDNFDEIFENGGTSIDDITEEETAVEATVSGSDRLFAVEEAILEIGLLLEDILNG